MRVQALTIIMILTFILGGCKTTGTHGSHSVLREIPRAERTALMVLNFKNSSVREEASEFEPWEFGIPSMIITDLESIGIFNILSWERLKDVLEQQAFQSYGLVDEKEAVKMGKIVSAKYTLTGSFMIFRGNLKIESKVISVEKGTVVGAAQVNGPVKGFFKLEKELVVKMTSYLGAVLTDYEATRLEENIETKSVDASLENYAGEMARIRGDELRGKGNREKARALLQEAKLRFRNALEYDPDFERARNNLESLTLALPMTL